MAIIATSYTMPIQSEWNANTCVISYEENGHPQIPQASNIMDKHVQCTYINASTILTKSSFSQTESRYSIALVEYVIYIYTV